MRKILVPVVRSLKVRLLLICVLVLVCTGCSLFGDNTGKSAPLQQGKGTATAPALPIRLGVQSCPDKIKDPTTWKSVVELNTDQSVEHVLCGDLLGIAAPQAVVLVRHTGSDSVLDVFVYSDITATHPTAIFNLKGLLHGDAKISGYNTLLTTQEDRNSLYNKGQKN